MNRLEFSFGNAVGHFQKTGGPKGFLWKFALTYALFAIIVQGLSLYLMAPIYAAAFNPIVMEDPDVMDHRSCWKTWGGCFWDTLFRSCSAS